MYLSEVELHHFRSYAHLRLRCEPRGALLYGANGSGKSNLLEAMHVLCMGRSQRGCARVDMIAHGAPAAAIRGVFVNETSGETLEIGYGLSRDGTVKLSRQGMVIATQREWFGSRRVVSFGPEDLRLLIGPPAERRRFLDMLLSQLDERYLSSLMLYNRALANRNRLLCIRGDPHLLDVYEQSMAEHGAYIIKSRCEILTQCQELTTRHYRVISGGCETVDMRFRAAGLTEKNGGKPWEIVYSNILINNRKRDVELGYTSCGPHRDDVLVLLDKRNARTTASQGQLRSLALALRFSALQCIHRHGGPRPLVLIDDAVCELDDARSQRVYPLVRDAGQVFFAVPQLRSSIIPSLPRYTVCNGNVISE